MVSQKTTNRINYQWFVKEVSFPPCVFQPHSSGNCDCKLSATQWVIERFMVYEYEVLYTCSYKGILSLVTTGMETEDVRLNEISQTQKDKYFIISFICCNFEMIPGKQKIERQLSEAVRERNGKREILFKGCKVSVQKNKFAPRFS